MSDWLLLILVCTLLLLLPLMPALLEWRLKRDALPLKVVRAYDGNIRHFANSFRAFVLERFPELSPGVPRPDAAPGTAAPRLSGESYQIVDGVAEFSEAELNLRSCSRMLISKDSLTVTADMFFEKELYAGAALTAGNGNSFRAILAVGDLTLGDDCAVLRWAHTDASMLIGERAKLYGRVSADLAICVQRTSRFGRMAAPEIRFGAADSPLQTPDPEPLRAPLEKPLDILNESSHRWLVAGSLDIPAATHHAISLVSHRDIRIGDNSRIDADIKSNGDLHIGRSVRIEGSLVATGTIHVGPHCIVKGPIVGDRQVVIETGCVIGRPDTPTTVTAAEIRIEEGVIAHGTVWARELGFVSAAHAEAA